MGVFAISSCQKSKDEKIFAVGKVDLISYCEESCPLSLKLITSELLTNIKVISTDSKDYTYTVEQPKYVSLMETSQPAHLYLINFNFSGPTEMSKVSLELDNKIYDFNIGSFKCVAYENTISTMVKDSEEHFQITQVIPIEKMKNYIYPTQVAIYLKNTSTSKIYVKDIKVIDKSDKYGVKVLKVMQNLESIEPGKTNNYANVYFENTDDSTMHTSSVIQIDYKLLDNDYHRYVKIDCGYTDELVKSVILGNNIYQSTLVLGVIREDKKG